MRFIILILATTLCHGLLAQDDDRFRNFHGIKHPQNNVDYFEAEGYGIFIQPVDYGLDEKGISKIRKKYSKDGQLTTDSVLNIKVLAESDQQNGMTVYAAFYLIPITEKKSQVVGFARPKTRDITLERYFISAYVSNKIPSFVYSTLQTDSVDFAGRMIELGPPCRWMSPHNIQCPDYGQMNWAIFDDLKQAEEYRDIHYEMAKNKSLTDLKEEKWIPLKFEGQEIKARRVKFKVQVPKLIMGGSNLLVVYYVTGPVRGKYVTAVISHYTDDVGADELPPLPSEVLELVR